MTASARDRHEVDWMGLFTDLGSLPLFAGSAVFDHTVSKKLLVHSYTDSRHHTAHVQFPVPPLEP